MGYLNKEPYNDELDYGFGESCCEVCGCDTDDVGDLEDGVCHSCIEEE